ncbi:hypothetical protein NBRC116594_19100 [Shimia sp. NS0008-38b]|uniref:permease n=1 Tax=Shimia sp. NS0008-38b TaxID=3127653 RepID=UPI003105C590
MNIVIGTLVLGLLAAWVWQKLETNSHRQDALRTVRRMVRSNLPRLVIALITAGLLAELLPANIVQHYLGHTSGLNGLLIACALGMLTPGGGFVSFALAAGALKAGAATPTMIAYLLAWSQFSLTKVIAEELIFLGPRFILTRVAVTFPIPLLIGGIAMWLAQA